MSSEPPTECPHCGAVGEMQPQYATGAGWRVSDYRCRACGERVEASATRTDHTRTVALAAVGLAAVAAVVAVLRRLGRSSSE
ncbi:hypothetical protein [Halospeciosus flavus]|uniref:C2H2-type domain-containing protein n=1 Tax=Halospeciosus flavus TaxID=3032283 RepID=A0ABD5Z573_9EURY|nr:hypothetical protein [Halospeciosus flavus]